MHSPVITKCISLLESFPPSVKEIHAFSLRHGLSPENPTLTKHLILTATNLSLPILYAHKLFDQIPKPNIFTFNTLIRAYAQSQFPERAFALYREMRRDHNVGPDSHTFPFLLKAVARMMAVREGEMLHSVVLRNGFHQLVFVRNALVSMYSGAGDVESAYRVFREMAEWERDRVGWNSVINGFAVNGRPNEALTLFLDMGLDGVFPDGFTMVSLFTACSEIGALALGRRGHVYGLKAGLLRRNLHVCNALLDFYAKCGGIRDAQRVFDEMDERNVVSWTSLIVGLAVNGFGEEAIGFFKEMEMERERFVPTEITFVGVLYACSHCGMVDEGFEYFRRMTEEYGIAAKIEHYGCVVDLLGRAGRVKEAYEYICSMPMQPNGVIWRTLLGACSIHRDLALGEIARTQLLRLEPGHSGDYVLLSNLYASERRWSDVQKVRRKMLKEGVRKTPGYSLVELGNRVYEFVMGDRSHPQSEQLYAKLAEITKLLRLEGYVPHTKNVHADIEEEEKEGALSYHSEKVAIAFMLINTPKETPITVIKNLRVCSDCHLAIKLISKVFNREIVVRDRSRFHHFRNGACSCKDYW